MPVPVTVSREVVAGTVVAGHSLKLYDPSGVTEHGVNTPLIPSEN
jgi:hypothetical protein